MTRAVKYNPPDAPGVTAILPDANDIALAKLVAWREKDIDWLEIGIQAGVLSLDVMKGRLASMPSYEGHLILDEKFQILAARLHRYDL